jgi:hypothetical protein
MKLKSCSDFDNLPENTRIMNLHITYQKMVMQVLQPTMHGMIEEAKIGLWCILS